MAEEEQEEGTHIAIFNGKAIRRKLVDDKWFFSVVDVVGVLTDSENPRNYWKVLKSRLIDEGSEVVTFCNQLKLIAEDGKLRETDCSDTEGIFRIIQSILLEQYNFYPNKLSPLLVKQLPYIISLYHHIFLLLFPF